MPDTATALHHGWAAAGWALANLVLGYVASFPLFAAVLLGLHVRAWLWSSAASPLDDDEVVPAVYFLAITGIPVLVAAVLVNDAVRRRLGPRGWFAVGFWMVTSAFLLVPGTFFLLTETSPLP